MYATSYSNAKANTQPLDYTVDFSFLSNIAQKRGQKDEQAYQYLDSLKSKALNIQFLQPEARKKVEGYNKEITDFFTSKDLNKIDLADFKTTNSYAKIFDKIATDSQLLNNYDTDKQMQAVMKTYQEAAKNPSKTGYNESNHNVWNNEILTPYMQETDLNKTATYNPGSFSAYYDYHKDLNTFKGQIHFDGNKFEIADGKGGKQVVDVQGISANKVYKFLNGALPQQAINQMITEAKSNFYNHYNSIPESNKAQLAQSLFEKESAKHEQLKKEYRGDIDQIKGEMQSASPEKKLELQAKLESTEAQYKNYDFTMSPTDFTSLSKVGLANRFAGSQVQDKLQNYSQGIAYQIIKKSQTIDQNFWKTQDYSFAVNKETYKRQRDVIEDTKWQAKFEQDERQADAKIAAGVKKNSKGETVTEDGQVLPPGGFFTGIVEGSNTSGVTDIKTVDEKLKAYNDELKFKNPDNITKELITAQLKQGDGTMLSNYIKRFAGDLDYNGVVTDEMVGYIRGKLKLTMEHGQLSTHFNRINQDKIILQEIKDRTWREITDSKPGLRGKDDAGVQAYFKANPGMIETVRKEWNDKLTASMNSVRGTSFIIGLEKDKENSTRNLQIVTNTVNESAETLTKLGLNGKVITPNMIATATYDPMTTSMTVTFKGNYDSDGKVLQTGIANSTITVPVSTTVANQFGGRMSSADINFKRFGKYQGEYQGYKYSVRKAAGTEGYDFTIIKPDGVKINSNGYHDTDGNYKELPPQDIQSIEAFERDTIIAFITQDKAKAKLK
jgi:hypothetical protein